MDEIDFWYSSADSESHLIDEKQVGDLPGPQWIAFGDVNFPRMIYLLHHDDDDHPDDYFNRPYMTVFGFGRSEKERFLNTPQTFSIGFVESTVYGEFESAIKRVAYNGTGNLRGSDACGADHAGRGESAFGVHWEVPDDWREPNFDYGDWPKATTYTEEEIGANKPAYMRFREKFAGAGAQFIWSSNVVLDNEVLLRHRVN